MKWSFTGVGLIVFGLIGLTIIMLFEQITTSNENDYYLLKEITNAAMIDSIDFAYYRETGDLKIVREKFVENFTRRYSESTLFIGTKYTIFFYDIMEEPPKATILIDTGLGQYRIFDDTSDYNVQNNLTGILEYVSKTTKTTVGDIGKDEKVYKTKTYEKTYYSMPSVNSKGKVIVTQPINLPKELDQSHIKVANLKIEPQGATNNLNDILMAILSRDIDWAKASSGEVPTAYPNKINTQDYTTYCDIKNTAYYDCKNEKGTRKDSMCANNYEDNIWIYWDGESTYGKNLVVKLKITFTYDEYEY